MSWRLHRGDCLDLMAGLEPESVDALVCDPPYGLGKPPPIEEVLSAWLAGDTYEVSGGGFMGRRWDAFVPGPHFWRLAFRAMKPGAHGVVFAGQRTIDVMGIALRMAGFEVRDLVGWQYWCLDEETEILTDRGWARYNDPIVGSHALCFDTSDNSYRWGRIDRQPVFDFEGVACSVDGDRTSQIVTAGHRCVVERGGAYRFAFAGDLAQERSARVPVVEGLRGLLSGLPMPGQNTGGSEQVLRPLMRDEPATSAGGQAHHQRGVRGVRDDLHAPQVLDEESGEAGVLQVMQRESEGAIACDPSQARTRAPQSNREREAGGVHVGRAEPSVARRRGGTEQEGEARGSRSVPGGVLGHGKGKRIRAGAPAGGCNGDRSAADPFGSRSPHGPRPIEQRPAQPGAVCLQPGSQAVRGEGHTVADLVRVRPVAYRGKVWCVTVPTGAFVARRRGRVFVTGNSGFPKSHDVSKAIDRAAGAEREVIGASRYSANRIASMGYSGSEAEPARLFTAPATPDAARWEGWGTALKPSIEPALLIRKPLSGTVAANVLRYGTGGLNVDGCRYPFGDPGWPGPQENSYLGRPGAGSGLGSGAGAEIYGARGGRDGSLSPGMEIGRWPANVYACPKASTAERERGCEGLPAWSAGQLVDRREGSAGMNNPRAGAGRTSKGRCNKHPCVKPVRLLRWLSRLVTAPGGTVLDPFAGSGSCGVAAVLEGFDYLGAELEADYQPIAEARIAHAVARPDQWLDTRPGLPVDDDTIEAAEAEAMGQIGLFGGGE